MPIDPETGREYPYTEEGIEQNAEDTGGGIPYTPFKMKGSPIQRNFGIGSPVKQDKLKREGVSKPIEEKKSWFDKLSLKKIREERNRREGEKIESDLNKEQNREKMPTVNLPQHVKDKLPTDKQRAKSKGTLKGRTGFESDVVDPVKSKVRQGVNLLKTNVITDTAKKMIETDKKGIKKVKDYFTKR